MPVRLGVPRKVFPTLDKPLQIPLLDEGLDLLLEVVAFESIISMVPVEAAVLVSKPIVRVTLQFVLPSQCHIVPYLHKDLIQRGVQGGKIYHTPRRKFWPPVVPSIIHSSRLSTSIRAMVVLPLPFLWCVLLGDHCTFDIHVFRGLV